MAMVEWFQPWLKSSKAQPGPFNFLYLVVRHQNDNTFGWRSQLKHTAIFAGFWQAWWCPIIMYCKAIYHLVICYIEKWYRWPIEIDGFPIKHCDFPWLCNSHNQMVMASTRAGIPLRHDPIFRKMSLSMRIFYPKCWDMTMFLHKNVEKSGVYPKSFHFNMWILDDFHMFRPSGTHAAELGSFWNPGSCWRFQVRTQSAG
jgi:hypothetical protein